MKIVAALSLLWIFIASPLAMAIGQQRVSSVAFHVRDAISNQPLKAMVSVNGTPVTTDYQLPPNSESRVVMDVTADAGSGHYARSFTVFLEAVNEPRVIYRIYLAPQPSATLHNRATVARGAQFLNQTDADRALALLEAVNEEASPPLKASQFGVYLKYNLWRAYSLNCTHRFVDYCGAAINLNEELMREQSTDATYFTAERISRSDLEHGSAEVADSMLRLAYQRAKWDLIRERPDVALDSLRQLVDAQKDDPEILSRLKIGQSDLDVLMQRATANNVSPSEK